MRASLSALIVIFLCACGVGEAEVAADAALDDSADSALSSTELKVATTGITAWLKPYATRELRSGREVFVLRGRASVNLENAFSYVPDDGFCETAMLTARSFETVCHFVQNGELNSLLSGLPLFVRLDQVGGKNATLRFVLEPRIVDATGSSSLWVTTTIKPIFVPEIGLTYRGKIRAPSAPSVAVANTAATISPRNEGEYNFDVPYEALAQAASLTGARFVADTFEKRAGVAFGITGLELIRTNDAYATWPAPVCTATRQSCLNAAGPTATDYEACGSYREVSRCNVPSRIPSLGLAGDDRSKIDAELAKLGGSITVTNYYVQAIGSAKPTLAQVVTGWQRQDPLGATFVADQTAGQLNTALDVYRARALVPAIQQTVLQQSFKAQRYTSGTQVYEVLYFLTAGRFVVIRLPAS